MKFVIETAKWKWASAVKSKNVYRDEEFIRTKTREEALLAIDYLMGQPKGLTYTITVFRDDQYFTYFRHSMPCLGGLVKYRDSHGKRYFMNPYFPRDIYVAFPEGDIIFIACHRPNMLKSLNTKYYDFILSQESPWVSAFGHRDTIIFKNNYFVLTNMDTDPTVFYSLMRMAGFTGSIYDGGAKKGEVFDPKAIILSKYNSSASVCRLAGQRPIRISGGTWAEGYGYTRPYNESIFKTRVPTKFEDFHKLQGYPQANFKNSYFLKVMKETFGINKMPSQLNAKINDALVEAWDFFKEESKKLGNGLGPKPKKEEEEKVVEI